MIAKWLTAARGGGMPRRCRVGEGLFHVLAENPLDVFRKREVGFGQHALVQVDDVQARRAVRSAAVTSTPRAAAWSCVPVPREHDGLVGFRQLGRGGRFGGERIGQEDVERWRSACVAWPVSASSRCTEQNGPPSSTLRVASREPCNVRTASTMSRSMPLPGQDLSAIWRWKRNASGGRRKRLWTAR